MQRVFREESVGLGILCETKLRYQGFCHESECIGMSPVAGKRPST